MPFLLARSLQTRSRTEPPHTHIICKVFGVAAVWISCLKWAGYQIDTPVIEEESCEQSWWKFHLAFVSLAVAISAGVAATAAAAAAQLACEHRNLGFLFRAIREPTSKY